MVVLALLLAITVLIVLWSVLQTIAAMVLVGMWPGGPDPLIAGILLAVLPPFLGGLLAMDAGSRVAGAERRRTLFWGLAAATVAMGLSEASEWLARPSVADPARAVSALVECVFAFAGLILARSRVAARGDDRAASRA